MSLKDIKNKLEKMEALVNVNDEPAEWALNVAGTTYTIVPGIPPRTEEQIRAEALALTKEHGTRENYEKAMIEYYQSLAYVAFGAAFNIEFGYPGRVQEISGKCDMCEQPGPDETDVCPDCKNRHPNQVTKLREYRRELKSKKCRAYIERQ